MCINKYTLATATSLKNPLIANQTNETRSDYKV